MSADLDQRVSETRQDLRRREKLRAQIQCARADLAAAMKRKKALAVRLEEEGEDVAKLERLTFTSLIADLLGEREARLDGERRELAEARLR